MLLRYISQVWSIAMKNRLLTLSTSLFIAFSMTSAVYAHSAWVAQRSGKIAVVYGHGASDEAYDAAKVKGAKALSATGDSLEAKLETTGSYVAFNAADMDKVAVFGVTFDNGFWTQKPDGKWVNEPRSKHPDGKAAGQYIKHVVSVVKPLQKPGTAVGHDLEIVPLADPLALKVGDDLKVKVLLKGKPLADAEIIGEFTTDPDVKSAKTDANGEATIKVRNFGLNVLVTDFTEKVSGNPDADEIGHNASLSFTLFDMEE
jgi:nickel transport protein